MAPFLFQVVQVLRGYSNFQRDGFLLHAELHAGIEQILRAGVFQKLILTGEDFRGEFRDHCVGGYWEIWIWILCFLIPNSVRTGSVALTVVSLCFSVGGMASKNLLNKSDNLLFVIRFVLVGTPAD